MGHGGDSGGEHGCFRLDIDDKHKMSRLPGKLQAPRHQAKKPVSHRILTAVPTGVRGTRQEQPVNYLCRSLSRQDASAQEAPAASQGDPELAGADWEGRGAGRTPSPEDRTDWHQPAPHIPLSLQPCTDTPQTRSPSNVLLTRERCLRGNETERTVPALQVETGAGTEPDSNAALARPRTPAPALTSPQTPGGKQ